MRVATGDIVDVHVSEELELKKLCALQTSADSKQWQTRPQTTACDVTQEEILGQLGTLMQGMGRLYSTVQGAPQSPSRSNIASTEEQEPACADEHASEPATGVSCLRPAVATVAVERGRARGRGRGRRQDAAGVVNRGVGGGDGGGRRATPADTTDAATPAATAAGRISNAMHIDNEIRALKEQVFQVEQLAQPKEHARNILNARPSEKEMYYDQVQEILCLRTKLEATERKLEAAGDKDRDNGKKT